MKHDLISQLVRHCKENPQWHYKSVFEQMHWKKKNGAKFVSDTITRKLREAVERGLLESKTDVFGYAQYRVAGGETRVQPVQYETIFKDGIPYARAINRQQS